MKFHPSYPIASKVVYAFFTGCILGKKKILFDYNLKPCYFTTFFHMKDIPQNQLNHQPLQPHNTPNTLNNSTRLILATKKYSQLKTKTSNPILDHVFTKIPTIFSPFEKTPQNLVAFTSWTASPPLDVNFQVLAVAMLTSKGAAGVSGAGFITLAATLGSIHPDRFGGKGKGWPVKGGW